MTYLYCAMERVKEGIRPKVESYASLTYGYIGNGNVG